MGEYCFERIGLSPLFSEAGSMCGKQERIPPTSKGGNRTIFHVDCEPGELNNRVPGCIALVSELKPFLKAALDALQTVPAHPAWKQRIDDLKNQWPDTKELADLEGINPNIFA